MPAGLEVFNSAGQTVVSITSRLTKLLGQVNTGVYDGSITVPVVQGAIPWFFNFSANPDVFLISPVIRVEGNLISWRFGSLPLNRRVSTTIFYGVR